MRNEWYNNNKTLFDLHLVLCGSEKCNDGFTMPPHIRSYYLIHYIESGCGYFVEKNRKHKIATGDVFVICPDTMVEYYPLDNENNFTFCWIGFTGSHAWEYLKCAGVSEENLVIHLNNSDFFSSVHHMVETFETLQQPSELSLNRHLLRCIRSIEKATVRQPRRINNSVSYTEDAITYIEKNYMLPISANDVVGYLNLNRSYLFRIFKQQTGMSIQKYLIKIRIEKAQEFIQGYDFTFSQIASFVGINNIHYFSKLFKKITGLSPTEYKAKVQRGD